VSNVDRLLAEVEEEYAFDRLLPTYMFAWSLAGLGHDRSQPDFLRTCLEAFDAFGRAHPELRRVEVPWPIDLTRARPLAEASPVVLDLNPDSSPSIWVQALVHPDQLPRTMMDLEAVKYLMEAYFHQDWVMDGGATSHTVASFLNERRELVAACADQLDELLRQDFPEGGLEAQLVEWGCDYYAGDKDGDYRAWLDDIRKQIRTALTSSAAS